MQCQYNLCTNKIDCILLNFTTHTDAVLSTCSFVISSSKKQAVENLVRSSVLYFYIYEKYGFVFVGM
jgi:hypothetical protein